jgi:hypothetical protein
MDCGTSATYVPVSGIPVPICGRGATCADEPIADISGAPTSPQCSCTGETYARTGAIDSSLTAYSYDDTPGCLSRVHATALQRIVEGEFVVSLTKTQTSAQSLPLNLTLELSGTDWLNGSDYAWYMPTRRRRPGCCLSSQLGVSPLHQIVPEQPATCRSLWTALRFAT